MWQTSNPALREPDRLFEKVYGDMVSRRSETASLQGVVNKTTILVGIALIAGAGGYSLVSTATSFLWITAITSLVVTIGVCMVICGNPAKARALAPVYAVVEGLFLGAFTRVLDRMLGGMDIALPGGLALQAFVITIAVTMAVLGLYSAKILRPTETFISVIKVASVGAALTYGISFILMLVGVGGLPLLTIGSAFGEGWAPLAGIGINLLFLGIASLGLVMDFKQVEDLVATGAPRSLEWYGAFGLLVSLAWIYYESVKLVFRLAILLNSRD
jgi:uncharacterized YccA/Bax inhibitor family protein